MPAERRRRRTAGRGWRATGALIACLICEASALAVEGSNRIIGSPTLAMTQPGDTAQTIARRHDVGAGALQAANPGLDPRHFEQNIVRVPAQHLLPPQLGDIVINLAELRLYAWRDPASAPITMPIGQGRDCNVLPTGTALLERDGSAWRLAGTDVRITAASVPASVGTQAGDGCIELYPEDFVRLAFHARPGQRVALVDQPIKVERVGEELMLEVHADDSGRRQVSDYEVTTAILAVCSDQSWKIDWAEVRAITNWARGIPSNVLRTPVD